MPDISFKVDLLSDATRDNIGFKNAAGVQQYVPKFVTDSYGNVAGIAGADGVGVLAGPTISGVWFKTPSIFRLRFTGTGTATLDSRDSLGNITAGVNSYTLSGATDQIEFPYAGDKAVNIRVNLTGNVTCEVI